MVRQSASLLFQTMSPSPVLMFALLVPLHVTAPAQVPAPESYLRTVSDGSGTEQRLQVASRTFARDHAPTIELVGAIHIADADYYKAVQAILDAHEVVLFEAVRPPGAGDGSPVPSEWDDPKRARMTERRVRFLGSAVESYRRTHGTLPATMADLRAGVPGKLRPMVAHSLADYWGRPITLRVEGETFDVVSVGSDGAPGGEGAAADLHLSDQKPLTPAEKGEALGLQQRMAKALGLTFQMDGVDYAREHWRNSDMSMDQVQEAVGDDAQAGALFSMLDGSSIMGRLAGFALAMIEGNPRMAASMKVMMLSTLSNADAAFAQLGPEMGRLMRVIIDDRNGVVIRDLGEIIADEPGVKSVAVLYGAGHMNDLEKRLVAELGYTPGETRWVDAIRVDLREAGMTPEQAKAMQETMQRMMERRSAPPSPR